MTTTHPTWSEVDDETGSLLDLLADPSPIPNLTADLEWQVYVTALRAVATANAGRIPANALRPTIRGLILPSRIGAFTRRAQLEGLIAADGWSVSDDRESGNAGRPARDHRWIGGPL